MDHPLAQFRNQHHLSQDELANLSGITRQIVTFTEQGIYPEIPPSIINGIKEEYGLLATTSLQEKHQEFIKNELDQLDIRPWLGLANGVDPHFVPAGTFVEWRNLISSSVTNFGKLLKIQPITIRKYESGQTHNLPIQLVERLKYFGFSDQYIASVARLPIGS